MGRIAVLDQITADKIAAGEVVERPASIVKELIENAIDAGASEISVEISEGGLSRIRVTDNGCGMDRADAEVCFQRHATSKINKPEDLSLISTLGFRGEALPSIAAVAEVCLRTRPQEQETGCEIKILGGTLLTVQEIACTAGTSLTVDNLFFNVPARKKFLKKAATEKGYVQDIFNRYLLAYPEIHFVFTANGKQLSNSYNKSLLDGIGSVYGAEAARQMVEVKVQGGQLGLSGYVSLPTYLKSNRHAQSLYINRRYIKNQALGLAVERGYRNLLPIGRHPLFVLNLTIDTQQIDVNVHPSKQEIKIAEENSVCAFVMQEIARALERKSIIPTLGGGAEPLPDDQTAAQTAVAEKSADYTLPQGSQLSWKEERTAPQPAANDAETGQAADSIIQPWEQRSDVQNTPDEPLPPATATAAKEQEAQSGQADMAAGTAQTVPLAATAQSTAPAAAERQQLQSAEQQPQPQAGQQTPEQQPTALQEPRQEPFPQLEPLGQYNKTYILAEGAQGLYLIDQHAAHERVRFEQFSRQFDTQKVESQMLLLPLVLELSSLEQELLTQYIIEINQLGFILELFGEDTFLIRAVPFDCTADVKGVFMELLEKLKGQKVSRSQFYQTVIALMACKRAIKANDRLSLPEMQSLLEQLAACRAPYTCPHGRPTLIVLTLNEIARRFRRI